MFKFLKAAVCKAEQCVAIDMLHKISPGEAELLKDPAYNARLRFRCASANATSVSAFLTPFQQVRGPQLPALYCIQDIPQPVCQVRFVADGIAHSLLLPPPPCCWSLPFKLFPSCNSIFRYFSAATMIPAGSVAAQEACRVMGSRTCV